jgi:2-polyprenyl-3-methyl-5-hydroxy-6-metoxy-1,4-benzoquinol methylase
MKSAETRNLSQYKKVHFEKRYGVSSEELEKIIILTILDGTKRKKIENPSKILDFGCGQSEVASKIGEQINAEAFKYDPAIDAYSKPPSGKYGIVLNTDVLEHLDLCEIDILLNDIKNLSSNVFFHIATAKSAAILPSGENAHSTVKDKNWWHEKISNHFETVEHIPSQKKRCTFVTWEVGLFTKLRINTTIYLMRLKKKIIKK